MKDALDEITGLSDVQACGIKQGLSREDVLFLDNDWHIFALANLKPCGLTADMLTEHENPLHIIDSSYLFGPSHYYAMQEELIGRRNFTVAQALDEIADLSDVQAQGIRDGLVREDVLPLTNFWHISVLAELKPHGLTAEMLLGRSDGGYDFDSYHNLALLKLVEECGFTIAEALAQIDGLSSDEASEIYRGASREEVLGNNDRSSRRPGGY